CLFFIWPLGLAGMLLPYTRPDLFEKSTFQYKIGGVPVMTILGTLTFAVGWYVMIMTATEEDIMAKILNIILVTVGLLLLAYMWAKNQREGIDPNKIFTEIPLA
ncbi:MAG: APC family permease, partial [Thermoplasmata archaeon]